MGFASDTQVRAGAQPGVYDAAVAPGWDIAGNANGGYLMAIAARALAAATGRPDPITLTSHFLAPGRPGPLRIETQRLREGRRFATASATLSAADGRALIAVLGTCGELEPSEVVEFSESRPPELPEPSRCEALADFVGLSGFRDRVDLRLHPEDCGYLRGQPSGRPRVRGWFRLPDAEALDVFALPLGADSFPPTIFNLQVPQGWVPTLELTLHLRARPAPGWLRCAFSTRFVSGGFLEEDGELWDETGRLVAQSRQLALLPRPGARA